MQRNVAEHILTISIFVIFKIIESLLVKEGRFIGGGGGRVDTFWCNYDS